MTEAIRWHPVPSVPELQRAAASWVLVAAARVIAARGVFRIVLAGGETPRPIYSALRRAEADWSRWQIYFGDERCAPPQDPARNSRMAADAWLDHVSIPAANKHPIPAEKGAVAGAEAYAQTLSGVGEFDLVLLGLGEDGHTASLFPSRHRPIEGNDPDVIAVLDAPKPPPERVSLSASRLSRTREALVLVTGEGKRDAIERWRRGEILPISTIRPSNGVDVLLEASLLT
jgi:6-phosphogluconolactonase